MSDKEWRTIHGCKCKTNYKVGDKEFSGGICVYGGNDGSGGKKGACPAVHDYHNLSKHCIKDAYRKRCIIDEQGKCGYRGVDWGGVLSSNENWDYCGYSSDEEIQNTNAGVGAPLYKNPMKNVIGLIIFIFIFVIVIPFTIYYLSKHKMYSLAFIANIPLWATIFSFRGGFFDTRLFSFIYKEVQETTFERISRMVIYFISSSALLTLILNIALKDRKHYDFSKIAAIVITYFITNNLYIDITHFPPHTLPHNALRYLLTSVHSNLNKKNPEFPMHNTNISIIIASIIIACLVAVEGALLTKMLN